MRGYVIYKINKLSYGLDLKHVKRIIPLINITAVPMTPNFFMGTINLQGDLIPVINLYERFEAEFDKDSIDYQLMIIESADFTYAFLVDDVLQVFQAEVKDTFDSKSLINGLEQYLEKIVLIDGTSVPIYNLMQLLNEAEYTLLKSVLKDRETYG